MEHLLTLLGSNVFANGNFIYYVYKIDLEDMIFKAMVVAKCNNDEDGTTEWCGGLCEWFSLDNLKGAKKFGVINSELELETEDIEKQMFEIAKKWEAINDERK